MTTGTPAADAAFATSGRQPGVTRYLGPRVDQLLGLFAGHHRARADAVPVVGHRPSQVRGE
jgi:hypothetical protein